MPQASTLPPHLRPLLRPLDAPPPQGCPFQDCGDATCHVCGLARTTRQPNGAIPVTIPKDVLDYLWIVAERRNAAKLKGTSRRFKDTYTDVQAHFVGVKAEYCAAIVLGTVIDETSYGAKGDTGIDLWVDGVPWAVKGRHLPEGDLVVPKLSEFDPVTRIALVNGHCRKDACVCCQKEHAESWDVYGWITANNFRATASCTDWGRGPRWWVRQSTMEQNWTAVRAQTPAPTPIPLRTSGSFF